MALSGAPCGKAKNAQHHQQQPPVLTASLIFAIASFCTTVWRVADSQDPELLPAPGVAYGSPTAAAAYVGWPTRSHALVKVTYFVAHFPQLSRHLMVDHWTAPDVWCIVCSAGSWAVGRALRLGPRARGLLVALSWVATLMLYPVAFATCASAGDARVPCEGFRRSSLWQCAPCSPGAIRLEHLEDILPLKLGIILALLPDVRRPAICATIWAGVNSALLVAYARYGVHRTEGFDTAHARPRCAHAAEPLTWPALAEALSSPRIQRLLLTSLASCLLVPVLVARARGAMRRRSGATGRRRGGAGDVSGAAASTSCAAKCAGDACDDTRAAGCADTSAASSPAAPAAPAHAATAAAEEQAAAVAPAGRLTRALRDYHTRRQRIGAAAAAAPASFQYVGALGHSTLSVKVSTADDSPEALADLEQRMPGIMRQALARALARRAAADAAARAGAGAAPAAAAQPQPPAPVMLSYAGFRGCYACVFDVAHSPEGLAAAFADALPPLLPPGCTLLSVAEVGDAALAAGAAGVWVDPVCLPRAPAEAGPAAVTLLLPPSLLRALEAQGCGLRVVAAEAMSCAPLMDERLRPGDARWPGAEGALLLGVPRPSGSQVVLSLLRTPLLGASCGAGRHGADELFASLHIPVVPAAACAELEMAWAAMVEAAAQERPEEGAEEAAAAAYSQRFLPFAHDLCALLVHGPLEALLPTREALLRCVREWGLPETEAALLAQETGEGRGDFAAQEDARVPSARASVELCCGAAGQQAPPPTADEGAAASKAPGTGVAVAVAATGRPHPAATAVATAGTSTPPPPCADGTCCAAADAADADASTPPPPPRLDARALVFGFRNPEHEAAYMQWRAASLQARDAWSVAFMALRLLGISLMLRSTSPGALVILAGHNLSLLGPGLVFLFARRAYLRRRSHLWAGSMLAHLALIAAFRALLPGSLADIVAAFQRPLVFVIIVNTVYPWVHALTLRTQAVAGLAEVVDCHLLFPHAMTPPAYLLLPLAGLAVAGRIDWVVRGQWLAAAGVAAEGSKKTCASTPVGEA